jgi:hypothetical protein
MRVFTIIGIVCLVIGGFFAYQAWLTPPSDNPFDVGKAAAPIVAITFLIIGFTFTIVGSVILRMGRARKELLTTGLVGRAEIVSATQTSMYVNEQPVVQLQLNVSVPGRAPYQVSHREVVPLLSLAVIQPGHSLPVAVDPANANKIAIDWGGVTAGRVATFSDTGAAIGASQMGWAPGVAPTEMPLPNTLSAMPSPPPLAAPAPNTLSSLPGIGQSLPPGAEGGVGFAAPAEMPPPTMLGTQSAGSAGVGIAAYLAYLKTSGIAGRAVIRTVQDTRVAVVGDEVLALQLEVAPAGGAGYPVTTATMVPQRAVGRAVPGASLAVYIDRSNPQAIAIDWDAA